ncbi:GntR family transcriptional regulator [Leucobacter weissii]|uniref:GntR family transcriptional regulator n=1 Tax=Leucobacter weissii TaxID=1983706 RepID=A0A939S861_9MICO|nr:GntR family transcriptional regulator [Leucobacter weissii]MBO1901706.1 GntR family transcriptional regulator [Leucobacter weissii]
MAPTARASVYDTLRTRLASGHYAPDAVLVPNALSEEFGVSRTPVREALAFLERDGLLSAAQRGYGITHRSQEEILELFEARARLDAFAAEAASARRSPIDLASLHELSYGPRTSGDPSEVRATLSAWHERVRTAAHNSTVTELLGRLDDQIKVSMLRYGDVRQRELQMCLSEHRAVFEAIRESDGAEANRLMLTHLEHDRDLRIRHFAEHEPLSAPRPFALASAGA